MKSKQEGWKTVEQRKPKAERPWWQSCSITELRLALEKMQSPLVESLEREMKSALDLIQRHMKERKDDTEWAARADRAKRSITERLHFVRATRGARSGKSRREKLEEIKNKWVHEEDDDAFVDLVDLLIKETK